MSDEAKQMIQEACEEEGFKIIDWVDGEDGPEAVLGSAEFVGEEDDDRGLYEGDNGALTAAVVGAPEYRNQRVSFALTLPGRVGGEEVQADEVNVL